jgi:hypothetical protein
VASDRASLKAKLDRLFRDCLEKLLKAKEEAKQKGEALELEELEESEGGEGMGDVEAYVPDADLVAEFSKALHEGVRPVNHVFTKIHGRARLLGAPSSRHSAGGSQHPRLPPDRGERGTGQIEGTARTITPGSSGVVTNPGLRSGQTVRRRQPGASPASGRAAALRSAALGGC